MRSLSTCLRLCVFCLQFIEMLSRRYFTMVIDEWCTSKRYSVFDDKLLSSSVER